MLFQTLHTLFTSPRQHLPEGLRVSQTHKPSWINLLIFSGIVVRPLEIIHLGYGSRHSQSSNRAGRDPAAKVQLWLNHAFVFSLAKSATLPAPAISSSRLPWYRRWPGPRAHVSKPVQAAIGPTVRRVDRLQRNPKPLHQSRQSISKPDVLCPSTAKPLYPRYV